MTRVEGGRGRGRGRGRGVAEGDESEGIETIGAVDFFLGQRNMTRLKNA
jgi:hypothetical protein